MADEECRRLQIDGQTESARALECGRDIRCLEEAAMDLDGIEALSESIYREAVFGWNDRYVVDIHAQQNHALMENAVVLEIVQQRAGYLVQPRCDEDRGARDAKRGTDAFQEAFDGNTSAVGLLIEHLTPGAPHVHVHADGHGDHDREPAAFHELQRVRGEEQHVDHEKQAKQRQHDAQVPF